MPGQGWNLGGAVAFAAALALYGAGPALAGTTIDSYSVGGAGSTFAECGDTSIEHTDRLPPNGSVQGSGSFALGHSFAPATAQASCASGSSTDSTSGGLSSTGTVDSSQNLTLRDSNHGSTTTTSHFTGGMDCIDVGAQIATSNTVQFTITQAMPYSFSGTATSSGQQTNGKGLTNYKLTGPGPSDTVFDQTQGAPSFSGTLQPGSYTYQAAQSASNDLACSETGTETDSYHYNVTLRVGTPLPAKCTEQSSRRVTIRRRTVNGRSKIVGGTLPVQIRCDQPATLTLSGQLTDHPPQGAIKHFHLSAVQGHAHPGATTTLKLTLPAAAATDLVHHATEKVSAALAAQNAHGTSHVTATFSPLRT